MARGQPDFGMYAAKEVTASISDMGEVAARLGGLSIYDRRGEVVDYDDFESPILRWDIVKFNGETAVLDSTHVRSGSQAVKLSTEAVTGSYVLIYKYYQVLASRRLGFEISFSNLSTVCHLQIWLQLIYATGYKEAMIRLCPHNKKLYYRPSTGGIAELADIPTVTIAEHAYYPIKFVVDFDLNKYVRLLYAFTEYDLSSYAIRNVSSSGDLLRYNVIAELENRGATAGSMWYDNYILTQAEP